MIEDYKTIILAIVKEQEGIIGPLARQRAESVKGLSIDWTNSNVNIDGDPKTVIDKLVSQYRTLFGQISVEVCKEAATKYLSHLTSEQMPSTLR